VWWIVPFAIVAYALVRWRPAPWTWPLLALCVAWPETLTGVLVGGTSMWIIALVAAGLLWHWPAALILLKPSVAPLALVGARDRRWWAVAFVIGIVSLPGLVEYLTVVGNAETDLAYSLGAFPGMLLPAIAWAGRTAE
jgi:uncharacterized membrane protein